MARPLFAMRTPEIDQDNEEGLLNKNFAALLASAAQGAEKKNVYGDIIDRASQKFDVPYKLIKAIVKQESGGNADAKSPVGATGLMQLMPETAKEMGVTNPNDPEQNIMGGTKYFRGLMDRFGGDVPKSLAGYNAGPGAVLKYGGIPPYKETQGYVRNIMGNYAGGDQSPESSRPTATTSFTSTTLPAQQNQREITPDEMKSLGLDEKSQRRAKIAHLIEQLGSGVAGVLTSFKTPEFAGQYSQQMDERQKNFDDSRAKKLAALSELIKAKKTTAKLPNSAEEYEYYVRDATARREPVKSYDQWQIAKAQAGAQAPIAFERLNSDIKFKEKSQALQQDLVNKEVEAKKQRSEEIKAREQDKSIERLSSKLGNSQDAVNTIGEIEKVLGFQLEDYDAEKGTVKGKEKDLPGISVLGLGRVSFYSGDAKKLENTMSKLFNLEIKDRSGAAVTSNELERLRDEYSNGMFNTEAEKIAGLQRYKNALYNLMVNQEAGFTPEAVAEYKNRSGVTSERLKPRSSAQPKSTGQTQAGPQNAAQPQLSSEDQQALEWARKNSNDPRAVEILKLHGAK